MLSNKPRIGITSSAEGGSPKRRWPTRRGFDFLKKDYSNIIIEMGGVPLPLVNTADKGTIAEYAILMDGLVVTGGDDINPA